MPQTFALAPAPAPARPRTLVFACLAALATLTAGIAYVLDDGPLDTAGGLGICYPPPPGDSVHYTGVFLPNGGTRDIDVWSVEATGTNLARVGLSIDLDGPALDQAVGGIAWPSDAAVGYEAELLARAVTPGEAVIASGSTAQLLLEIVPEDPASDATVDRITVHYASGWRDYTETYEGYTITAAAGSCA